MLEIWSILTFLKYTNLFFVSYSHLTSIYVSNYVACASMKGESGLVISEEENEDIVLVGSARGEVRGVSPADFESPSSRVMFSFQPSHQPIVQVSFL